VIRRGLFAISLVLAGRAHAEPKAEAKDHVARGSAAFQAGHYDDALKELTFAYALEPDPELLYAIGQVHVKLGDCESATTFFQRFAATKPDKREAAVATQAIAACKDHPAPVTHVEPAPEPPPQQPIVAPTQAPPPPPSATPPPAPAASHWYSDVLGDALVIAGVAAGGIGVGEYAAAVSSRNAADTATTYGAVQSKLDDAGHERALAIGFAAGGGALAIAGVLKLVLSTSSDEHAVAVVPVRGGSVISWGRSF
jgi:tetratricopeptide (TPR) repeat protein